MSIINAFERMMGKAKGCSESSSSKAAPSSEPYCHIATVSERSVARTSESNKDDSPVTPVAKRPKRVTIRERFEWLVLANRPGEGASYLCRFCANVPSHLRALGDRREFFSNCPVDAKNNVRAKALAHEKLSSHKIYSSGSHKPICTSLEEAKVQQLKKNLSGDKEGLQLLMKTVLWAIVNE
ncbi:hypothetical protein FOL47_004217, partial [Perkinsus chesapeaki]